MKPLVAAFPLLLVASLSSMACQKAERGVDKTSTTGATTLAGEGSGVNATTTAQAATNGANPNPASGAYGDPRATGSVATGAPTGPLPPAPYPTVPPSEGPDPGPMKSLGTWDAGTIAPHAAGTPVTRPDAGPGMGGRRTGG